MIKVLLIIFREVLEISIFLGVITAATTNIANSRNYIILGGIIGIVIASLLALFFSKISMMLGGLGEEIFAVAVIFTTVIMIAYTVISMRRYSFELKKDLKDLTAKIQVGATSKLTITLMVATTILREGIEIILFLHSFIVIGQVHMLDYLIGISVGGVGALLVGYGVYSGLMIISPKYLFKISSILLVFIAAGISSEAAAIMTSSGMITIGSEVLWDSSWLMSDKNFLGKVFKVLMGYTAIPNVAQVVFYISTLLGFFMLNYCVSALTVSQSQKVEKK